MRLLTLLALLLLAVGCVPITAPVATEAGASLVFENVRVFDGEEVIANTTVVLQDGRIAAVGEDAEIPQGAEVIDGEGKTLLPGLIDAHTHVFGEDVLQQALIFGVTTELDMFMSHQLAEQLQQAQAQSGATGRADLFSAGTLATAPGGHGTQFGLPIQTLTSPGEGGRRTPARTAFL